MSSWTVVPFWASLDHFRPLWPKILIFVTPCNDESDDDDDEDNDDGENEEAPPASLSALVTSLLLSSSRLNILSEYCQIFVHINVEYFDMLFLNISIFPPSLITSHR